MPILPVKTYR